MNETREVIMDAVRKADHKSVLFLISFPRNTYDEIISQAVKERDTEYWEMKFGGELGKFFSQRLIEDDEEEEEESLEDFAIHIAYKIRNAGTKAWIQNLKKEVAESIVNGIGTAGNCKITLGNGEQFDALKLARVWEEAHGEKLDKRWDWNLY